MFICRCWLAVCRTDEEDFGKSDHQSQRIEHNMTFQHFEPISNLLNPSSPLSQFIIRPNSMKVMLHLILPDHSNRPLGICASTRVCVCVAISLCTCICWCTYCISQVGKATKSILWVGNSSKAGVLGTNGEQDIQHAAGRLLALLLLHSDH